jgi:hypothetical protein
MPPILIAVTRARGSFSRLRHSCKHATDDACGLQVFTYP